MKLTGNAKALVVIVLFQLIFGGCLAAKDQFVYSDSVSAVTVLVIYVLIGVFAAMFLSGNRMGLIGMLGVSSLLVISHTAFIFITSFGQVDAGLHDPLANWWATMLRYPFFLLTLIFSIKIYRERRAYLRSQS